MKGQEAKMELKDVQEIAGKVKNILENRGWAKNIWYGRDGSVCLAVAIDLAMEREMSKPVSKVQAEFTAALAALALVETKLIPIRIGTPRNTLIEFNDQADTTVDDVYALLDSVH